MLYNIFKCNKCKREIISEERDIHSCKKISDYKFENDLLWVNDGERWYPLKFSPNFKHPNGTPKDSTEPFFLIKNYNIL